MRVQTLIKYRISIIEVFFFPLVSLSLVSLHNEQIFRLLLKISVERSKLMSLTIIFHALPSRVHIQNEESFKISKVLIKAGPVGNIVWPAGVQWLLEAFYFIRMYILQTYFGYRCINLYSVKKNIRPGA